jgi:hypothetical protein
LTFGDEFNQPLDNLPQSLTHLEESRRSCLTHLTFNREFNQSVDNLPENLIYLSFGEYFNKEISKTFKQLKQVNFRKNYRYIYEFRKLNRHTKIKFY